MNKQVEYSCPLGHTCQTETDQKISRCRWYVHVMGRNPQTGAEIDEWDCAISFMPLIQIEGTQQARFTTSAVQKFQNEMVNSNERFIEAMVRAKRLENTN